MLASSSPRRRALLERLGVSFDVVPSDVDETGAAGPAEQIVRALAARKAEHVLGVVEADRGSRSPTVYLGSDTVIAIRSGRQERILGKPGDVSEARDMLQLLSGRAHRVVTGVALASSGEATRVEALATEVGFRRLTSQAIEDYLATGDYAGKAGAYGIQSRGSELIEYIRGCYYNIVGLPLELTATVLRARLPVPFGHCDCSSCPLQRERGAVGC